MVSSQESGPQIDTVGRNGGGLTLAPSSCYWSKYAISLSLGPRSEFRLNTSPFVARRSPIIYCISSKRMPNSSHRFNIQDLFSAAQCKLTTQDNIHYISERMEPFT